MPCAHSHSCQTQLQSAATTVQIPRKPDLVIPSDQQEILIPDLQVASVYPITFTVPASNHKVGNIRLTLNGLEHTYLPDVTIILSSPDNTAAYVWSGGDNGDGLVGTVSIMIGNIGPPLGINGSYIYTGQYYNPSAWNPRTLQSPAPVASNPYFSNFYGLDVGGTWNLWIEDLVGGDSGSLLSATLSIWYQ